MNIDFTNDPGFSTYVLLLMFSGLVMLALGSTHTSRGLRALNVLFGLGFVCYGFYLAVLFEGGSYIIFFKAFILPVVMVYKTVKSLLAQSGTAAQVAPNDVEPNEVEAALAPEEPVATVD